MFLIKFSAYNKLPFLKISKIIEYTVTDPKKETTEENRIRVVAYARVSTETERQQGSFESQKSYYYENFEGSKRYSK